MTENERKMLMNSAEEKLRGVFIVTPAFENIVTGCRIDGEKKIAPLKFFNCVVRKMNLLIGQSTKDAQIKARRELKDEMQNIHNPLGNRG